MNWMGQLKRAVAAAADLTSIENVRNFSGRVEPENITKDKDYALVKGDAFEPERTYFSVRLVEMRLSEADRYGLQLLPMCCCFLRYNYGGAQRNLPYVVG